MSAQPHPFGSRSSEHLRSANGRLNTHNTHHPFGAAVQIMGDGTNDRFPPTSDSRFKLESVGKIQRLCRQADGDGFFDVLFEFATANPQRFGPGEAVTYTVSGIAGLDETDFNFISVNGPVGNNGWPVAAHIQGIGTGGNFSGWVTVPEPAFGALALLALPMLRRR